VRRPSLLSFGFFGLGVLTFLYGKGVLK